MIKHLLLILFTVSIYEFFLITKFKKIVILNLNIYKNLFAVLKRSKISDSKKEKMILNYSQSLLLSSLKIFGVIICIFVPIFFIKKLDITSFEFFISIHGICEAFLIFLLYYNLRKKFF
ncbi:MAG: hypothetical protein CMP34_02720 [Rickettsiales bacterium]|nr:hypothetical protein [Rickettsiales bacterium]